jgi:hypothetical protein
MLDISKRRGRPPKESARSYRYQIRLNAQEHDILEFISHSTGLPKSTIFRAALQTYYELRYGSVTKK